MEPIKRKRPEGAGRKAKPIDLTAPIKAPASQIVAWLNSGDPGNPLSDTAIRDALNNRGQVVEAVGGLDILFVIPHLVADLRAKASRDDGKLRKADAQTRQAEADAASSELALERSLGNLVSVETARRAVEVLFVDAREKARELMQEMGMTDDQASRLCEVFASSNFEMKENNE